MDTEHTPKKLVFRFVGNRFHVLFHLSAVIHVHSGISQLKSSLELQHSFFYSLYNYNFWVFNQRYQETYAASQKSTLQSLAITLYPIALYLYHPPVTARDRPWPPVTARDRPWPPVTARRIARCSLGLEFFYMRKTTIANTVSPRRTHQLAMLMLDAAFNTKGYTNWKDATRKKAGFSQHERWPVSPGSCSEKHYTLRHDQGCRRAHIISPRRG